MKAVFADSLYWIAIARPRDPWSAVAYETRANLGDIHIVTTDEVLGEFLTGLGGGGTRLRQYAAKIVRNIVSSPRVTVIPQSRQSFLDGLRFYEMRGDKEYSFADCVSMNTMRAQSLSEALTNDHHFEQEGFTILMWRRA